MSQSAVGADALPTAVETGPDPAPMPPKPVRSRRVSNPWFRVNRRTQAGRELEQLVFNWLDIIGGDASNNALVADLISLGELYQKAASARSDPKCSPASCAWIENAYFRRAKQLGLTRHHRYSTASPLVRR
jgi:hypothetical protein